MGTSTDFFGRVVDGEQRRIRISPRELPSDSVVLWVTDDVFAHRRNHITLFFRSVDEVRATLEEALAELAALETTTEGETHA